ncbi:hypothetical protein K2173_009280 [Erythroxylum novogranatense]|uniref:DUF4283 domain-containing protein n=1 Tax=Erythroxylum novogranatense TaxID=1862640 RepID=A0AAV8SZZ6_9ROSI|nr:hypothetical protein K2173_009280 [Erythroxylum novogranatense]
MELFSGSGLSYIASAIGNPLYMDSVTASQTRLDYAKVCVEIDVVADIPKTIYVVLRDGTICSVWVAIPWMPLKCDACKVFGHAVKGCPKKTKQVWVPKVQASTDAGEVTPFPPVATTRGSVSSAANRKRVVAEVAPPLSVVEPPTPKDTAQSIEQLEDHLVDSVVSAIKIMDAKVVVGMVVEPGTGVGVAKAPSPKKIRAAAAGVAEVLKDLHKKKKAQVDRGKRGGKGNSFTPPT